MALFLLEKKLDDVRWEEFKAKLIRAGTEEVARKIANEDCGNEGRIWEDEDKVKVRIIKEIGKDEVIITDFNAG